MDSRRPCEIVTSPDGFRVVLVPPEALKQALLDTVSRLQQLSFAEIAEPVWFAGYDEHAHVAAMDWKTWTLQSHESLQLGQSKAAHDARFLCYALLAYYRVLLDCLGEQALESLHYQAFSTVRLVSLIDQVFIWLGEPDSFTHERLSQWIEGLSLEALKRGEWCDFSWVRILARCRSMRWAATRIEGEDDSGAVSISSGFWNN